MNILASYNWIKEYLGTKANAEEFAREISLRSVSVEFIHSLAENYANMVIGVIESIEPHPKADRLRLAKTSVGKNALTIVCGGVNLAVGQKVIVALPGARVKWHGEGDLITLEPATIRGVASEGMICAAEEIGFEKAQTGEGHIWDITQICDAPAGTPVADALGLNDILFDIEVTTNRPDAMNMIGIAREAGACDIGEFNWQASELPKKTPARLPLQVRVENKELCARYMAVALDNVKVGPSPLWLQMRLLLAGHRPINNVVDVTNYILHEYGQPLHAFDYDRAGGGNIVVRNAKAGEMITALDGKEYKLQNRHLLITDGNNPLAVAGVMGGEKSGTYADTTRLVIEAATFDGAAVRRTARDLNLYSDSQSMYEKGLSTESLPPALARAIELLQELAGAEVASEVIDVRADKYEPKVFTLNPERVNQQLGVEISAKEQTTILKRLGFEYEKDGAVYKITVPYWRDHDIEDDVDLVEEIARVYGYHNVPSRLPAGRLPERATDSHLFWEEYWKHALVGLGYTEFFSNSLVSCADLEKVGVDLASAVAIHNPLTADLTHMRTTLVPSLLKSIELNQAHHRAGKVFEIARVYTPVNSAPPVETTDVLIAQFGYKGEDATAALEAYRAVKGAFEELLQRGGAVAEFERADATSGGDFALLHNTRAARVLVGGKEIGFIGEISADTAKKFGVDVPVMALVVHTQELMPTLKVTRRYEAEPTFPSVTRDLSLLLDSHTEFLALEKSIHALDSRVRAVRFKEQYIGKGIAEGKKSVTMNIVLRDDAATLEGAQVEEIMGRVNALVEKEFGAQVR